MSACAASDTRFATTLAHGLDVLEAFAQGPMLLSNKALAERTGLSKATVTRLTTTLATRGLVEHDAALGGHRLGTTALTLGYPLLSGLGLRRVARLPMKQLADALGATVSLGMRDRSRMVYVETSSSNRPVSFRPDLGAPVPMLQTAMGRAWLAAAQRDEREAVLDALQGIDPAHVRRWQPSLRAAGRQLRQQGFCISPGDWLSDIHAVAVPLGVSLQGERLVLNCGMPAHRLAPRRLESEIGPGLMELAAQIEAEWTRELAQGTPPTPPAWLEAPGVPGMRPPDPDDKSFARTLARGIDLLLCFGPTDETLGNRELARRLDLSPTTIVRLTHTLCERGYLRRDTDSSRYRLGGATLAASYPILAGLRIRRVARPAMLALAQRVQGAVSLGLRHRDGMVYVETAWRTDERLLPPDTGAPMPMLLTAMGRAWLSRADRRQQRELLNRLRLRDPQSWQRHHAAALEAATQCRRRGWCSSRDFRSEIVAVAVPLREPVDSVQYVMNCGVLAKGVTGRRQLAEIGEALMDTVREVEELATQG